MKKKIKEKYNINIICHFLSRWIIWFNDSIAIRLLLFFLRTLISYLKFPIWRVLKLLQRKFTKFFQLVRHVSFVSLHLMEKFRESKSRSLYYHRAIFRVIFCRESWLAKKNYKTLQNFFSLFSTFSRILERRAPNTCCPKIPPTPSIRKSHKMYTHISSLSLCWHKSLTRKWDKDLIIRIKPSSSS